MTPRAFTQRSTSTTRLRSTPSLLGTLRELDPIRDLPALTDRRERNTDLGHILQLPRATAAATHPTPGRLKFLPAARVRAPRRVGWVAGIALTAVLVAALLLTSALGPRASLAPTFAATPVPLSYSAAPGVPGADRLNTIAGRAALLPATQGRYEHLVSQGWGLTTSVAHRSAASAIIPGRSDLWRYPDGSGTVTSQSGAPQFDSAAARRAWVAQGLSLRPSAPHTSPLAGAMWHTDPPTTTRAMSTYLAIGHPSSDGPAETIAAVDDLLGERALTPKQRAATLHVLARLPRIGYGGPTRDRAGRPGWAFWLDSAYSGLPTRYTLVVDPHSGQILDSEETLTTTAGALNVRVPAVIGYTLYLVSEHRTHRS